MGTQVDRVGALGIDVKHDLDAQLARVTLTGNLGAQSELQERLGDAAALVPQRLDPQGAEVQRVAVKLAQRVAAGTSSILVEEHDAALAQTWVLAQGRELGVGIEPARLGSRLAQQLGEAWLLAQRG